MKNLEFATGYINLELAPFIEVYVKPFKEGSYAVWLSTSGRDMIVYQFADEDDAKRYQKVFWRNLKNFIHNKNDEEKLLELMRSSMTQFLEEEENG